MKRGEIWWARLEPDEPVVLLSGDEAELRAIQIVRPATTAEKCGFVVLSGEEASDDRRREEIIAAADATAGGVGIEVRVGGPDDLPYAGVVRVALPRDGSVYCTWLVTLTGGYLLRQIGVLSHDQLRHLTAALRLAGIE